MDRRRKIAALLIAILGLGAASSTPLPLQEAAWIAPDARLRALTQHQAVCAKAPASVAEAARARTGKVAFHAPLLLGGQAARAGLSCASCHQNGRSNRDFLFPGLSGAPGTADVTSSLMSKHRGDGVFNPKPIPDLARDTPKVNRDPDKQDLAVFIRGLIVEEFDGPDPSAATLEGLATYVQLQVPSGCTDRLVPVRLADETSLVSDAVTAAQVAAARGDAATARLMLSSARSALGRIHERYAGRALARDRAALRIWDGELAALQNAAAADAPQAIQNWLSRSLPTINAQLAQGEPKSLYNPARLSKALGRAAVQRTSDGLIPGPRTLPAS